MAPEVRVWYDDLTVTEQEVYPYGFVVVTKRVKQFTRRGPKVSARFVRAWVRRDGAWLCVDEHLTPRSLPPL